MVGKSRQQEREAGDHILPTVRKQGSYRILVLSAISLFMQSQSGDGATHIWQIISL